jgi:transposase
VDRAKAGSQHHLVGDRHGVPLAALLTAANVNEGRVLPRLVDAIPPIRRPRGQPGRPRRRPDKLHADKAYDSARNRRELRQRHITPRIARRKIESSKRLGRYRWVVERDFAWLHSYRHLRIRYERDPGLHQAFLDLACALICCYFLDDN